MKKVCHLSSAHEPYDGRIFEKECVSLAKDGYEVYYIVKHEIEYELLDGVHIIGVPWDKKSKIKRLLCFTKLIVKKALEIDADIYHLHDPELLLYAIKLKNKGKIVIFDSHEFYGLQIREKTYFPKYFRKIISFLYMRLETWVCKRIDAVIQVCTIDGKNYFNNRCKRFIYLTNMPECSNFSMQKNTVSKKDGAIHIGSLTYNRGITHLVQAGKYTKCRIKLAGNFSQKKYYAEIKELPSYKNVDYLGYINEKEIPNVLNKCLIGIATLLDKGQYFKIDTFPTKVYEYMACGLPIVISNSKYNCEIVKQYKLGICVNPNNPKEIAEAINYLLSNPEEAKEMGKLGQKLFREEFNWDVEQKKLLELYSTIIKP